MYTYNESDVKVRVQMIDENPWFVAKDLCDYLELSDVRRAVEPLDDDEKLSGEILQSGQKRSMWLVNESGMYALVIRSNKPKAREFRKWITNEVLPSLRKTGRYEMRPRPVVVRRSRRAEVDADTLGLLWLIGESLWHGDQKAVAMELGVSVQSVNQVLNGYMRSPRILMALYRKARERREQDTLYTDPREMAQRLLDSGTGTLEKPGVGWVIPGQPVDTQKLGKKGGAR